MTVEDRLRSGLRGAAESMPTTAGSLAGVQARAVQLQRRRTAMRGSAGVLALVAVAAVGIATVRSGGSDDYATSTDAVESADVAAAFADESEGAAVGETAFPAEDMGAGAEFESEEAAFAAVAPTTTVVMSAESEATAATEATVVITQDDATESAPSSGVASGDERGDESHGQGDSGAAESAGGDAGGGEFAGGDCGDAATSGDTATGGDAGEHDLPLTISPRADAGDDSASCVSAARVIFAPAGTDPADVHYFIHGGHLLARAADVWLAHNGNWWYEVAPPATLPTSPIPGGRAGPASVVLHETVMLGVATSVEVSDGVAWLVRGDRVWKLGPIPDSEQAYAEVGWADRHLAVIVGVPEQVLYLVERLD